MGSYADEEGQKRMTFKVIADTYRILNGNGRRSRTEEANE
jgi:hypothetical protein